MLAALILIAQVAAAQTAATCRVPNDPQQRTWALERVEQSWRIAFSSRALDKPRVELPLGSAQPLIGDGSIRLSFASANGGRRIEWAITSGASTLDLFVNHGLEVNIERDLDPAVDSMNTEGSIAVECALPAPRSPIPDVDVREWQVSAGLARSVKLFQSTAGRTYAVQTIGWARDLTRELKIIGIRGTFAWGVEAMPVFAQFEPAKIYGFGVAPIVWRWNFPPQPSWSAYGELAMGGMWSSQPIPEDTSRGNFTAHWGGGVRLRPRGSHAVVIAYRFQHFSNGNQLGSNPGVNSHVILVGWSHRS